MSDPSLKNFVLVGGTSLALQMGHRISVDLDLFTNLPFDENELAEHLVSEYNFEMDFISQRTLKGEIRGVQIDCIAHQYPWVEAFREEEDIRLVGYKDLAAMKLNAISGNGSRIKDFIDVAFLSCEISLTEMLLAYELKYKASSIIPLKSMVFFDEINFNEPIKMLGNSRFNWRKIEKRLYEMQKHPDKTFSPISF